LVGKNFRKGWFKPSFEFCFNWNAMDRDFIPKWITIDLTDKERIWF